MFTTDNLKISSEIKVSILNELNQFSIMFNEKIIETIIRLNMFNHFEKDNELKPFGAISFSVEWQVFNFIQS